MIGVVMTASRFGYAAFTGIDAFVDATAQFAVKLALQSRAADTATAEAMVADMRGRVPQDTGLLWSGIAFELQSDGTVEVSASAVSPEGGADYANFVEKGTLHMDAEPYFYGPAEDALARRGQSLEAAIDAASDDFR